MKLFLSVLMSYDKMTKNVKKS